MSLSDPAPSLTYGGVLKSALLAGLIAALVTATFHFLVTEPVIEQVFIGRGAGISDAQAFERKLYVIRKRVEHAVRHSDIPRRGRFGLQIHGGEPAEAAYKDIRIKKPGD